MKNQACRIIYTLSYNTLTYTDEYLHFMHTSTLLENSLFTTNHIMIFSVTQMVTCSVIIRGCLPFVLLRYRLAANVNESSDILLHKISKFLRI